MTENDINNFDYIFWNNKFSSKKSISKRSIITLFLFAMGSFASYVCLADIKGEDLTKLSLNQKKIKKINNDIKTTEINNTFLESQVFVLNHALTQKFKTKEKKQILEIANLTATNDKQGSGAIVTLTDNNDVAYLGEEPNTMLVHSSDILNIVNDLWAGGAKAISINNQRINSHSEIRCAGPVILVNKTRIAAPFKIKALGTPELLEKSLEDGYINKLSMFNINLSIEKKESLKIPADGTIILSGEI